MFKGYCFPELDGWHTPAVTLNDVQEVFSYTQIQGNFFREVRITDGGDNTVVQMIDGKYTFPDEWKVFNKEETE